MLVRLQDLVVGRMIGVAAVGVYRTAWRTVDLISQAAILPFSQVSLTVLARLQDDLPAFCQGVPPDRTGELGPGPAGHHRLRCPGTRRDRRGVRRPVGRQRGDRADPRPHGRPVHLNYFAGPALAAVNRSGTLAWIAALQVALTAVLTVMAAPTGSRPSPAPTCCGRISRYRYRCTRSSDTPACLTARCSRPSLPPCDLDRDGRGLLALYQPLRAQLQSPIVFLGLDGRHRRGGLHWAALRLRPRLRPARAGRPPATGHRPGVALRGRSLSGGSGCPAGGLQARVAAELADLAASRSRWWISPTCQRGRFGDLARTTAFFRRQHRVEPRYVASISAFSPDVASPGAPRRAHPDPRGRQFRRPLAPSPGVPGAGAGDFPDRPHRPAPAVGALRRPRRCRPDRPDHRPAWERAACWFATRRRSTSRPSGSTAACVSVPTWRSVWARGSVLTPPVVDVLCLFRTDRERAAPHVLPATRLRVQVADWLAERRLPVRLRELGAVPHGSVPGARRPSSASRGPI